MFDYLITPEQFKQWKAEGKSDLEIMQDLEYDNPVALNQWKKNNGLTGLRPPIKSERIYKEHKMDLLEMFQRGMSNEAVGQSFGISEPTTVKIKQWLIKDKLLTPKTSAKIAYKKNRDLAIKRGICLSTYQGRVRRGWDFEKAATVPVDLKHRRKDKKNKGA